jgi:hypothetical protein
MFNSSLQLQNAIELTTARYPLIAASDQLRQGDDYPLGQLADQNLKRSTPAERVLCGQS